jgi:hypothetical protein
MNRMKLTRMQIDKGTFSVICLNLQPDLKVLQSTSCLCMLDLGGGSVDAPWNLVEDFQLRIVRSRSSLSAVRLGMRTHSFHFLKLTSLFYCASQQQP